MPVYQVPGTTMYTLAMYYMLETPLEDSPLLHSFVNGDDAYRNSRFKLIPYISKVRNSSGHDNFLLKLGFHACILHIGTLAMSFLRRDHG